MTGPDQNLGLNVPDSTPKPKASLQDILKTKAKAVSEKKAEDEAAKKAEEEVVKKADELEDLMTQTEENEEKTDELEDLMVNTDNKTEDIMTLSGQQEKLKETKLNLKKTTDSISESQAAYNSSQEALKEIYNAAIADSDTAELFNQSGINSWEDLPKLDGFSESKEAADSERLKSEVVQKTEEKRVLEEKVRQDLGLEKDSEEINLETAINQKVQDLDAKIDELKPETPEGFVEIITDVNTKMQTWFDERIRNTPGCDSSLEDGSWLNNLAKIDLASQIPDLAEEAKKINKDPQELQQAFLQKALHEFLDQNEAKRASLIEEVDSVKDKTKYKPRDHFGKNSLSGKANRYQDRTDLNDEIIRIQYKYKHGSEIDLCVSSGDEKDFLGSGENIWNNEKDNELWSVPESGQITQSKDGKYILGKVDGEAYMDYLNKITQIWTATNNIYNASSKFYRGDGYGKSNLPLDKLFKIMESDLSDEKLSVKASNFLKSIEISEEKIPKLVEDLKKASTALKEISTITKESMSGIEVSSDFARIWEKCGGDMKKMKTYIDENFKSGGNKELKSQLEEKTKAKLSLDIDTQELSKLKYDQDLVNGERKIVNLEGVLSRMKETNGKIASNAHQEASTYIADGNIEVNHPNISVVDRMKQDLVDKENSVKTAEEELGRLGIFDGKKKKELITKIGELKSENTQIGIRVKELDDKLVNSSIKSLVYALQQGINGLFLTETEITEWKSKSGTINGLFKIIEDRLKNGTGLTPAEKDKLKEKENLDKKIAQEKRTFEGQ